jgi:hypothetical protein
MLCLRRKLADDLRIGGGGSNDDKILDNGMNIESRDLVVELC